MNKRQLQSLLSAAESAASATEKLLAEVSAVSWAVWKFERRYKDTSRRPAQRWSQPHEKIPHRTKAYRRFCTEDR